MIVKRYVPGVVGVPRTKKSVSSTPLGKVPPVIKYLYSAGSLPPLLESCSLYVTPTTPLCKRSGESARAQAGATKT